MDFLQHNTIDTPKPKRGRPRKEIKKDIEDEIMDDDVNVYPSYDLSEYKLERVSFNNIIPNVIQGVGVHIDMVSGETPSTVLMIDSDCKSDSLSVWKKGIGGIFNKDVKKYLTNNNHTSKYFSMSHESGECFLVRLMDEYIRLYEHYNLENLCTVTIEDDEYILVREFDDKEYMTSRFDSLSDKNGYLIRTTEFKDDEEDNDDSYISNQKEDDEFDSYEEE